MDLEFIFCFFLHFKLSKSISCEALGASQVFFSLPCISRNLFTRRSCGFSIPGTVQGQAWSTLGWWEVSLPMAGVDKNQFPGPFPPKPFRDSLMGQKVCLGTGKIQKRTETCWSVQEELLNPPALRALSPTMEVVMV